MKVVSIESATNKKCKSLGQLGKTVKPTSIFHGRSLAGQPISTRVAFMQGMLQHDHLVLSQKITNCINERSMVVSWGSYQLNSTLWISYTNDVFKACLPSQLKPIVDCMKISCKESVVNDVPDGLIQAGARAYIQIPVTFIEDIFKQRYGCHACKCQRLWSLVLYLETWSF